MPCMYKRFAVLVNYCTLNIISMPVCLQLTEGVMEELTEEVTAEVMEEGTEGPMGSAIEEKKTMRRIWNVWSESASALEEAGHAVPLLLPTGSGALPEVLIVPENLTKDLIAPARDLHPTVTRYVG